MESTRNCTLVLHSLSKESTISDVESILLGVAKECQMDCIPKIRELSPNVPRRSRDWMAEVCQVSMEDQQRMAQMQSKLLMNGKVLKIRCIRSHKDPHHLCAFFPISSNTASSSTAPVSTPQTCAHPDTDSEAVPILLDKCIPQESAGLRSLQSFLWEVHQLQANGRLTPEQVQELETDVSKLKQKFKDFTGEHRGPLSFQHLLVNKIGVAVALINEASLSRLWDQCLVDTFDPLPVLIVCPKKINLAHVLEEKEMLEKLFGPQNCKCSKSLADAKCNVEDKWADIIHVIGRGAGKRFWIVDDGSPSSQEVCSMFRDASGHELLYLSFCNSLGPGMSLAMSTPIHMCLAYESLVEDVDACNYAKQIYTSLAECKVINAKAVQKCIDHLKKGSFHSDFPVLLPLIRHEPKHRCICVLAIIAFIFVLSILIQNRAIGYCQDHLECFGFCMADTPLSSFLINFPDGRYKCVEERLFKKMSTSHWKRCGHATVEAHMRYPDIKRRADERDRITTDCNKREVRDGYLVPPYADWVDYQDFCKFVLIHVDNYWEDAKTDFEFSAGCMNVPQPAKYIELNLSTVESLLVRSGLVEEFGFLPPCPSSIKVQCEFRYFLNLPKIIAMSKNMLPVPPGAIWVATRKIIFHDLGTIHEKRDSVFYRVVEGSWLNYSSISSQQLYTIHQDHWKCKR